MTSLSRDSWALWYLGYPDQALARSQEAVTLAHQIAHPLSLSFTWAKRPSSISSAAKDMPPKSMPAALHLATDQGFPHWRAYGAILHGWALAYQGEAKAGIEQLHQGMMARRHRSSVGTTVFSVAARGSPWSDGAARGRTDGAHGSINPCRDERGMLVRTRVVSAQRHLLLHQSPDHHVEAEVCSHQAINIAQSQQAKSFELRATTSLARLWQQQGKRTEARELLAPIYGWFTEGFDTADLQDAKALLDELEDGRQRPQHTDQVIDLLNNEDGVLSSAHSPVPLGRRGS